MEGVILTFIGFAILFITVGFFKEDLNDIFLAGAIAFLIFIGVFTLFHFHSKSNDINVSQELVNTIVETTGKSYHDVYYFLKYAGAADMDLIEAVMTIDPDLTEEEAAAIIQISDYKQR